jgi:hypothetical protein
MPSDVPQLTPLLARQIAREAVSQKLGILTGKLL